MRIDWNEFENPGSAFRGAPFWSWNDHMDEEEVVWQLREMKDKGMGGGFMHSRAGLATEYMGEQWMKCVEACAEEGMKSGAEAWLYDEDRWPSGFAGGLCTSGGDHLRSKSIGVFKGFVDGFEIKEFTPLYFKESDNGFIIVDRKDASAAKKDVYTAGACYGKKTPRLNNESYLDVLSKEAVRAFIDSTYEPYKKRLKKYFGKSIPGMFTDEPSYRYTTKPDAIDIARLTGPGVKNFLFHMPWTSGFDAEFKKAYGYGFRERIPEYAFSKSATRVRYDYWKLVTRLFVTNYTEQIARWCEKNNLKLTGHYLMEQTMLSQTQSIGSAMQHYVHMQEPGIDILKESREEVLTVKQVSSVAHQMGRERVLSELYGCSGWNFTFEGQKAIGEWQYALGINHRCQHLSLYSLRGCRKRDYPPSFHYQSPWWTHHKPLGDYFGRLSYILSRGTFQADILLLHPLETAWCMTGSDYNTRDLWEYNDNLNTVCEWLLRTQRDFDFGDEGVLAGCAKADKGKLTVGSMTYKTLIVPPAATLRKTTLKLIRKFMRSGGRVAFLTPVPYLIEGEETEEISHLLNDKNASVLPFDKVALNEFLTRTTPRSVQITLEDGSPCDSILIQERKIGADRLLYMVNQDRGNPCSVIAGIRASGQIYRLDAETGKRSRLESWQENKYTCAAIELAPSGSAVLMVSRKKIQAKKESGVHPAVAERSCLGRKWKCKLSEMNVRTLDTCRYRIDNESMSGEVQVLRAQRDICNRLGLQAGHNGGVQIWKYMQEKRLNRDVPFELEFRFEAETVPKKAFLLVEDAAKYDIALNNKKLHDVSGWMVDKSFHLVNTNGHIRKGRNQITIRGRFDQDTELESIYVAGDFGVDRKSLAITSPVRSLEMGDWGAQGLAFYGGAVVYRKSVTLKKPAKQQIVLQLPALAHTVTAVTINGEKAGTLCWEPYELDITDYVSSGKNRIEIEVVGSRRNMMGPHHNIQTYPWTGPDDFVHENRNWTDQYMFVPHGLMAEPVIEYRK